MSKVIASKPERSGCLTWWLIASVLFSILAVFQLLNAGGELTRSGNSQFFVVSVALVVVAMACLYGIYEWKRWGVYGYVVVGLVGLVLNMVAGTATGPICLAPFVQIGFVWYLVKDIWDQFD